MPERQFFQEIEQMVKKLQRESDHNWDLYRTTLKQLRHAQHLIVALEKELGRTPSVNLDEHPTKMPLSAMECSNDSRSGESLPQSAGLQA